MTKGKLSRKDQKVLKVLSKVVAVLTKICKVCAIIAIPCIALLMVAIPTIVNNVSVNNNDTNIEFQIKTGKKPTKVVIADGKLDKEDKLALQKVSELLENNSSKKIVIATEASLVFVIVLLVLNIMLLDHLYELFNSFYEGTTPFTEDNVKHLKMIAYLMIASLVAQGIPVGIMDLVLKAEPKSTPFNYDLLGILIVFVMSYIFKYGVELQGKSKAIMYDVEKEK